MIFILGGRGLVGSAFARVCERRGEPFTVIDRERYSSMAGTHCDLFINANGNSSKVFSKTDPIRDFDATVRTVRSTLVDFKFERYLHLSSCDVYANCSSPAVTDEEQTLDPARQSPYGFHKFLAEQCVRHSPGDWTIFRLGGFIGPGLKKNAVFDILNGGPLWLDPKSALQFLSTDAAAELMLDVAQSARSRQIFNLCGSGVIALSEILEELGSAVAVQPGSPIVRYDVSIEKISRVADVPETRKAVLDFVRAEILRKRSAAQ